MENKRPFKTIYTCFPQGKHKVLTMSYDDGKIFDRKLIEIFNKYGIDVYKRQPLHVTHTPVSSSCRFVKSSTSATAPILESASPLKPSV